jgi:hypothetical protein
LLPIAKLPMICDIDDIEVGNMAVGEAWQWNEERNLPLMLEREAMLVKKKKKLITL